ncbi:MAG TPA: GtrA family protein [Xanthobacteraceae bacterium]|nr:GtrA family protein [Xanthobacteraceae bacterium]
MRELAFQMFRFGLVGLVNAGVDAAVFFTAVAILAAAAPQLSHEASLIAANTASFVIAVTCSYILNSLFTFRKHHTELGVRAYFLFAASQIAGFVAHTATLVIAAKYVPLPLAKLLGIGVGFVVNFTLARVIVFRNN